MSDNLESNQPQVTQETLAEMVREIFAHPAEFAEKAKQLPVKLVVYLLVLTVCALITMIFHTPQEQGEQDESTS